MNLFSVLKRLLAGSSDTADIISHDEMMAVVSTHSHCLIDVREDDDHQGADDGAGDLGGAEPGITTKVGKDAGDGFQSGWELDAGWLAAI